MTTTLPAEISAASGLNAVAHAVEALYAPDASPIISLMAEEGVRAFADVAAAVVADGDDLAARSTALYGAWLCGACLGATTMSLHHKLCHVLGGSLDLPHAQTHAIVLPYALAYNESHAPAARAALQRALGTDGAAVDGAVGAGPAAADSALAGRTGRARIAAPRGDRARRWPIPTPTRPRSPRRG